MRALRFDLEPKVLIPLAANTLLGGVALRHMYKNHQAQATEAVQSPHEGVSDAVYGLMLEAQIVEPSRPYKILGCIGDKLTSLKDSRLDYRGQPNSRGFASPDDGIGPGNNGIISNDRDPWDSSS